MLTFSVREVWEESEVWEETVLSERISVEINLNKIEGVVNLTIVFTGGISNNLNLKTVD